MVPVGGGWLEGVYDSRTCQFVVVVMVVAAISMIWKQKFVYKLWCTLVGSLKGAEQKYQPNEFECTSELTN